MLPETNEGSARVVVESIRRAVEKIILRNVRDDERLATVTLSGGVARLEGDDTGESLLQRADDALYQANHGGRNQVALFCAA
jgi:diguanylate cyclase